MKYLMISISDLRSAFEAGKDYGENDTVCPGFSEWLTQYLEITEDEEASS